MAVSLDTVFEALSRSTFRQRMRLAKSDWVMLRTKGLAAVMRHAADFIEERLVPAEPARDGMQTPMRGHPVFTAQHATATCCRRCLAAWHHIPVGRSLTDEEKTYIAAVVRRWLETEMERGRPSDDSVQLVLDV